MSTHSHPNPSVTDRLVGGLFADLEAPTPGPLVTAGERALLDFIGCARGAAVGGSQQLKRGGSAETVAGALGILGASLDRDDLHLPSVTHPGSVIWPTVLAVGTDVDADGDALLRAAIVGYEIMGRIAASLGAEHRRYWHSTATAGAIGASAAAALLLGLDAQGIARAVGHATSIAGGSSQSVIEGSGTKLVHRAWAASSGVLAARCAEAGIPATRFGLEAERGLFAATSSIDSAEDVVQSGELWVIEELVNRFYASSGFCHAAIEAAASLAPNLPEPIGPLEITLPAPAAQMVGATGPETPLEAWWSAPYAVCVTLLHGTAQLQDPAMLHDDAVRSLLTRTTVVSGNESASIVSVDGQICAKLIYKGHPDLPLTIEELRGKCQTLNPDVPLSWNDLQISGAARGIATQLIEFILPGTPLV